MGLDEAGADAILVDCVSMLAAVNLDDQARGVRTEIGEVGAEGDLLAPMVVGEGRTDSAPEMAFGNGHILAQVARASGGANRKR